MNSFHRFKSNLVRGKHRGIAAILGSLILAAGIGAAEIWRIGHHPALPSGASIIAVGAGAHPSTRSNDAHMAATTVSSKIVEAGIDGVNEPDAPAPRRRPGTVALNAYVNLRLDVVHIRPFTPLGTANTSMNLTVNAPLVPVLGYPYFRYR